MQGRLGNGTTATSGRKLSQPSKSQPQQEVAAAGAPWQLRVEHNTPQQALRPSFPALGTGTGLDLYYHSTARVRYGAADDLSDCRGTSHFFETTLGEATQPLIEAPAHQK
jgi:hypothetical protein|uniref:Uncharacterized protein n=1 Tax=Bionectria ochroleuca TaxID=29856 RepID=A0A8H7NMG3_BIOOC